MVQDVDAIFVERSANDGGSGGVSFSGLLNALMVSITKIQTPDRKP